MRAPSRYRKNERKERFEKDPRALDHITRRVHGPFTLAVAEETAADLNCSSCSVKPQCVGAYVPKRSSKPAAMYVLFTPAGHRRLARISRAVFYRSRQCSPRRSHSPTCEEHAHESR